MITQEVTAVYENIVSGEVMENQSSSYSVTACTEQQPEDKKNGKIRYMCYDMSMKGQTTSLTAAERGEFEVSFYRSYTWPGERYKDSNPIAMLSAQSDARAHNEDDVVASQPAGYLLFCKKSYQINEDGTVS